MSADRRRRLGCGKPCEQGETERCADLLRGADARVQGLPQEREHDSEQEAERRADEPVAHGRRTHLIGALCAAHEERVGRLERLHRPQLLLLVDEAGVQRRRVIALGLELGDLGLDLILGEAERMRVELEAVLGELPGVLGRELLRLLAALVLHRELDAGRRSAGR